VPMVLVRCIFFGLWRDHADIVAPRGGVMRWVLGVRFANFGSALVG
jgi:hypothetical protein